MPVLHSAVQERPPTIKFKSSEDYTSSTKRQTKLRLRFGYSKKERSSMFRQQASSQTSCNPTGSQRPF